MAKLTMLTPDAKLAEIKRLYYHTSRRTIAEDLARALSLLQSMENEQERERAAVFMDGLSQMRSDWARGQQETRGKAKGQRPKAKGGP